MIEALIALAAAVFGGAGLKIIEALVNRNKDRQDYAAEIRDELRGDLTSLREEIRLVREDRDKIRGQRDEYNHALNNARIRLIHGDDIIRQLVKECDNGGVTEDTIGRAREHLEIFRDK